MHTHVYNVYILFLDTSPSLLFYKIFETFPSVLHMNAVSTLINVLKDCICNNNNGEIH